MLMLLFTLLLVAPDKDIFRHPTGTQEMSGKEDSTILIEHLREIEAQRN